MEKQVEGQEKQNHQIEKEQKEKRMRDLTNGDIMNVTGGTDSEKKTIQIQNLKLWILVQVWQQNVP